MDGEQGDIITVPTVKPVEEQFVIPTQQIITVESPPPERTGNFILILA